MSIGFHAELSQTERRTFYFYPEKEVASRKVAVRFEDLSEVSGVLTFGDYHKRSPDTEIANSFSFFRIPGCRQPQKVSAYKEGFIYNKQDEYVLMLSGKRILYIYGSLHRGRNCVDVPFMYSDLAKNRLYQKIVDFGISSTKDDLAEYLVTQKRGCGCRTIRLSRDGPVSTLYKPDCECCQAITQ